MSTEQNKAIVQRWFDGYNKGSVDLQVALADEVYTTDFVGNGFGFGTDLDSVKQFVRMVLTSAPKNVVTVDEMVAEGDTVVARFSVRGTDPATGKPALILGSTICRFTASKIAEMNQLMETTYQQT